MPKLLYLLRHAQSAEKQPGQADKDRELTPTGIRQAIQIGHFLKQQNFLPEVIHSSMAVRALMTAQMLIDATKMDLDRVLEDEELYTASVRTFLETINRLDNQYTSVMCVAHNPTISYLAEYITKAEIGEMSPAGLCIIKFNFNSWAEVSQGNGELQQYIEPSMLEIN